MLLHAAYAAAAPKSKPAEVSLEAPESSGAQSSSNQPIVAIVILLVLVFIFYLLKKKGGDALEATKHLSTAMKRMSMNLSNLGRNSFMSKNGRNLFETGPKDSLTLPKILPQYQKPSDLKEPEISYQTESKRDSLISENDLYFDESLSHDYHSVGIKSEQHINSPTNSDNSASGLLSPRSPISVKVASPALKAKELPFDTLYGKVFKNNLKKFF